MKKALDVDTKKALDADIKKVIKKDIVLDLKEVQEKVLIMALEQVIIGL